MHGLLQFVENPDVCFNVCNFPLTSSCFRYFAFLYTIWMSCDFISFLVLSNQLSNFLMIIFIEGFLWLYVVISLILFSVILCVGINNSSCVLFQAPLNAFSNILSGYPLLSRELTIVVASSLKSSSLLYIFLALINNP